MLFEVFGDELKPADLKIVEDSNYVYRSWWKRLAARIVDQVGTFLLGQASEPISFNQVQRLALLRLDHLGDVLQVWPLVHALKVSYPNLCIDLFVGPWGKGIAEMLCDIDRVHVVQADWFARPVRIEWPWRQIGKLGQVLKKNNYDMVAELRGDLRHLLAIYYSGIKYRLGYSVTAGRFFLTRHVRNPFGVHEAYRNLDLFVQSGILSAQSLPDIYAMKLEQINLPENTEKILRNRNFNIAIQAACGSAAKRWSIENWAKLMMHLPKEAGVILLGSESEKTEMQSIAQKVKGREICILAGQFDLGQLALFLSKINLLISVDSGPAHLASVQGVPVFGLYSGTNRFVQWGIRGRKTGYIQKTPECSPCELTNCPVGNACMNSIEVEEVLNRLYGDGFLAGCDHES